MTAQKGVEKFVYRFFGCFYAKFQNSLWKFVEQKIPRDFLNKEVSDLGCGDGINTLRIQKIFQTRKIIGYENNNDLILKAKNKGLEIRKMDLNKQMPSGEMAVFNLSLHHLDKKETILKNAVQNFQYLVLLEPIRNFYHILFDSGQPLQEKEWIRMFDRTLGDYSLCRFKGFLLVFYKSRNVVMEKRLYLH